MTPKADLRAGAGPALGPVPDPDGAAVVVDDKRRTELGAIFTKRWVAELVLDLAGYTDDLPLYRGTVLEPACGHGAFVEVIVGRLLEASRRDDIDITTCRTALVGMDVDPDAIKATRKLVRAHLVAGGVESEAAALLARHWIRHGDFLKTAQTLPTVQWVVGNPPYVRIEDVSRTDMDAYRSAWTTMSGRADVYVGFFEAGLSRLAPDGRLSFICADRWMRNRYGAALRHLVEQQFAVETCLVMHAVDAFEERVSAYPAITVLARTTQDQALVVEAEPAFDAAAATRLVKARSRGPAPVNVDPTFRASWLPTWPRDVASWPSGSPEQLARLTSLESRLPTLAETGAHVSVGVATGADDVFVVTNPDLVEPGLAVPTLSARETALGGIDWKERWLISPWGSDGLLDLDKHPRLKKYLNRHRGRLCERYVAKKSPATWWRTIDRIDPAVAQRPKLLIPDLKDRIFPVFDQGKFMPLHSLYYVTSDEWDLAVLGGLLMSDVANSFVEAYSVKMANGYLRVSAQYLRRVRVPDPHSIERTVQAELRAAFWSRDEARAAVAARLAYGP